MDNVKFDFVFGKPAENGFGRWVEGNVVGSAIGHLFAAKLWFATPEPASGCQVLELDVAGPFRAAAFASFLSIITTARFATATRYLELIMAEDLDAQVYDDMLHIRTDPVQERDPGGLAPGQIALVEASLTQVKFREMLGRAVSSLPKARD